MTRATWCHDDSISEFILSDSNDAWRTQRVRVDQPPFSGCDVGELADWLRSAADQLEKEAEAFRKKRHGTDKIGDE